MLGGVRSFLIVVCLASGLAGAQDKFKCPSDGHFADENDCTKYYHCANGRSNPGYCPSGLFWDNGELQIANKLTNMY